LVGQEKAKRPAIVSWEYKVITPTATTEASGIEEQLNKPGKDGWEFSWAGPGAFIFKRALR
jgi:hypothetical protein